MDIVKVDETNVLKDSTNTPGPLREIRLGSRILVDVKKILKDNNRGYATRKYEVNETAADSECRACEKDFFYS